MRKFILIGVPPAVIESKLEEQNTVILNLTKTVSELQERNQEYSERLGRLEKTLSELPSFSSTYMFRS